MTNKRKLSAKDLQPVRAYLGDTEVQLNSPPDMKIVAQASASHPQGGGGRGTKAHSINLRDLRRGMEEW